MEFEYPMPQTFDDAVFWIEIGGYQIIAYSRSTPRMYVILAPDNTTFECRKERIIEAGKRVWKLYYNVSEVKAYTP